MESVFWRPFTYSWEFINHYLLMFLLGFLIIPHIFSNLHYFCFVCGFHLITLYIIYLSLFLLFSKQSSCLPYETHPCQGILKFHQLFLQCLYFQMCVLDFIPSWSLVTLHRNAIAGQWLSSGHVGIPTDMNTTKEQCFPWSMSRCYKQDSWKNELVLGVASQ